jgi:hypothetical protein
MRESSTMPPWRTRRRPRTATTSPCDQMPSRIESTRTSRASDASMCARYSAVVRNTLPPAE